MPCNYSMIFKTFNSDIDKSISKIGMFNKSFWAMQQDLKHGNGIGFSIFGGQSITSKDKQSILDLNTALKNGVKPAKAWATTMTNCSIAAQNQARQCLRTKGDLAELASGLDTTTVSAKAAEVGLKALSIAGNMLLMWGISEAIKLIGDCANASDRLKDTAEQLGSTFSSTKSDIDDYKTQIVDLYKVINDNTSSYEDTYTARQNLLAIQDEMIEKFGDEAEAVSLITQAVNGSTNALDTLTQDKWEEIKNSFNFDSDKSWTEKFGDAWANLWSGSSNNFQRMIKEMEDTEVTFHIMPMYGDETYEEFSKKLKEDYGASITRSGRDDAFTLSGNLDDIYDQLLNIKSLASDMGIKESFLNDLSAQAESAKKTLESYEDIYNQHILYDKIFGDSESVNKAGETYEEVFSKINSEYKKYQDAFATGDEETINKAKQNFAEIVQQSTEGISDQSVIDYFNSMYPDLQDVVGAWEFEVKFKAAVENDDDNFENEVKDAVGQFDTVEDIKNYNPKVASEEQISAYAKLNQVADDYNLTLDQLIDKLVQMGLLTSQPKEDLLKKLIPSQSGLTAGVASVLEDSMEQVNPDVATEWVKGLTEEEAKLANSPEFDKALERQKEKLNGATLSADNYSDALQEVKDSQNQIDADKTDNLFTLSEEQTKAIEEFESKVKSLGDTLSKLSSGEMTDSDYTALFTDFPELANEGDNLSNAIQDLIYDSLENLYKILGENLPQNFRDSLQGIADQAALNIKTISDSISDLQSIYDLMQTVKDEIANGGISASTLQNIASKYPILEDAVNAYCAGLLTEQELYAELEKQYNADYEAFQTANQAKIYDSELFYKLSLEKNGELVNELAKKYDLDLKNFKTVEAAKLEGETKLLGKLASLWNEYYSIVLGDDGLYKVQQINSGYDVENDPNYIMLEETRLRIEEFLKDLNESFSLDVTFDLPEISSSSSTSKTEQTFDWIEKAIQRVQEAISRLTKVRDNAFKTWSKRNKSLNDEIAATTQELQLQAQAHYKYMELANAVPLDDYHKALVQSGALDIETVTDDNLKNLISEYEELYQKAVDAYDAVEDLQITLSELAKTEFDNLSSEFDNQISLIESRKDQLDNSISYMEARGYAVSKKLYEELANAESANLSKLTEEHNALLQSLNDSVSNGSIEAYSEEWYNMVATVNDVASAIQQAETQLVEFQNTLRELEWDNFDRLIETINRITDESDFLIDLFSNDKLVSDKGEFTNEGLSTIGLRAVKYNVMMSNADKYAKELLKIQDELAKDPYNQTLIDKERELQDAQRDSIRSAEQEKQAMIDLAQEAIQAQIDALQELIDKKKESLNAEKDLYDYQKTIAEKTKNFANLKKQYDVALMDNSEEGRQRLQELKTKLSDAEQDLKDTQYDRWLKDQENMLDEMMQEYEDLQNKLAQDTNALLDNLITETNKNADTINGTIKEKADSLGYDVTEEMKNIWNNVDGENGIKNIVSTYSKNFDEDMTTVNDTLSKILTKNGEMKNAIDGLGTNLVSAINGMAELFNTNTGSSGNDIIPASPSNNGNGNNGTNNSSSIPSNSNSSANGVNMSAQGQKVSSASGIWYSSSTGGNPTGNVNRFNPDYFIVDSINPNGSYPYHIQAYINGKAAGGNGWVKGSQIGYKKGLRSATKDHWAWTQENGTELFYRNSDGAIYTPIGAGDTVFTKEMTKRLWEFAKGNPLTMPVNNFKIPDYDFVPNMNTNNTVGDVVVNMNLPNVTDSKEFSTAVKKAFQSDESLRKCIQAGTIDLIAGKNSFGYKKY